MNFKELKNEMKKTLNYMEVEWEDSGVDENLHLYKRNKTPLVEALRKSSHWNEDLHGLLFDSEDVRKLDIEITYPLFHQLIALLPDATEINQNTAWIDMYKQTFVNTRLAADVNNWLPNIRAQEGQKVSRLVNKIWKELGVDITSSEYQTIFAKFADAINPVKIHRPFILSANPSDYLTMSYGNTWASCHIINPDMVRSSGGYTGEYKAGTLSYMNDGCTLIGYTLEKLPSNLRDACCTPKITRQCFMVDPVQGMVMQSRQYPETNNKERSTEYRSLVQKAVAEIMGVPNLWKKIDGRGKFWQASNLHYPDYNYDKYSINTSYNIAKNPTLDGITPVLVGAPAFCLGCGYELNDSEQVYCDDCAGDAMYCSYCGDQVGRDEMTQVANGDWVCEDCRDRYYSYCEYCEGYYLDNDVCTIRTGGRCTSVACQGCVEFAGNIAWCNECQTYYDTDYIDQATVYMNNGTYIDMCIECAENDYCLCVDCDEWYETTDDDGRCEDCAAAYTETEEEVA